MQAQLAPDRKTEQVPCQTGKVDAMQKDTITSPKLMSRTDVHATTEPFSATITTRKMVVQKSQIHDS